MNETMAWMALGFLGQALFSTRFVLQWLASEKARRSIVPRAFWYFSLAGSAVLLAYAIHRADPVFIMGQSAGLAIYLRNLQLSTRGSGTRYADMGSSADSTLNRGPGGQTVAS